MADMTKDYKLHCRKCGQAGLLSVTSNRVDWSYATVGFTGLAVSRVTPKASVIRCNACRSTDVDVAAP